MTLVMNNRDGRYFPDKGVITDLDNFTPVRLYNTWTTPAVTNIVDNPSFENDIAGVGTLSAAVAQEIADSWVGDSCLKVTTTNVDGSGCGQLLRSGGRFAVTAGLAYTWSPKVKGTSGKNMTIELAWYNSIGANFQIDEAAFTFGSGWIQPTITITAPATAVTVLLLIRTDGVQGIFDFFVDASFLYQSATILDYVDGDQPGSSWAGTAHESTSSRVVNPKLLIFQGFIMDYDLGQDKLEQTASLICVDRMALWRQIQVSVGNILKKISSLSLHRIVDTIEGELIANPGLEWSSSAGHPLTGYSALNGAIVGATEIAVSGGEDVVFEGDWILNTLLDGAQAQSGWRYDATADIAAVGNYRPVVYARTGSGTLAVRFRFLRDAVIETSTDFTLTTSWQRLEMANVNLATLGTNRYIELVTDSALAGAIRSDALHCVEREEYIDRDFDAGAASPEIVNAYREAASAVIADVLKSEPGIMFIKAKTVGVAVGEGDVVAFRDINSRPSTAIPRKVFADGDGLLQFVDGLSYRLAAADRVESVTVTSRGTPKLGSSKTPGWELSPTRALAVVDFLRARYTQTLRQVRALVKGGVVIENENQNYGAGHDIDVTTPSSDAFIAFDGYPYDYSTILSSVTKTNRVPLPVKNHLQISMPLQGTASAQMATEAQRLLDKYRGRVIRLSLPLHQANDETQAFQYDVDLNELIQVRAKFENHSPGFDKKFWVEGIQHEIDGRGETIKTILLLEEA